MLQVVGGSDRLPAAFATRLKDRIIYRAVAREIRQTERGVARLRRPERAACESRGRILRVRLATDRARTVADGPFPRFRRAVGSATYAAAGKIGLQFKRRFWEEDDGIYGGATIPIRRSRRSCTSSDFTGGRGLSSAITSRAMPAGPWGNARQPNGRRWRWSRAAASIRSIAATSILAFSVGWHRVTWIRGSWMSFSADIRRELPTLRRPDGRVYLAGDHVSGGMNAWMQAALESARDVAAAIHARATQEVRTVGA